MWEMEKHQWQNLFDLYKGDSRGQKWTETQLD